MSVDQTLRCRDCGVDFIWTEGEQEFYASRGLANPPSRCPSCRAARRASGGGGGGGGYGGGGGGGGGFNRSGGGQRQMYEVPCAGCDVYFDPEECGKGFACMVNISPKEVFNSVMTLL